jgi:hypothetical protein
MPKIKPLDPSEFLDDDELVAEYLTAALEDRNPDVFLAAVGHVVKLVAWAQSLRVRGSVARVSIRRWRPGRSHGTTRCCVSFRVSVSSSRCPRPDKSYMDSPRK